MVVQMIRYVSNAGILLTTGNISIGIDCFCKDVNQLYPDTPMDIREELFEQIQEGKLKVLVFTHEHSDHFCLEDVKAAFEGNKELQIYSTRTVIEQLKKEGLPQEHLHVVADKEELSIEHMKVQFLYTVHEGEQYADVFNLSLLINKEDKNLVVFGDAAPTEELFQVVAEWSTKIHWLVVPFPYVGLRTTRVLLQRICPEHILAVHLPRKEADEQQWITHTKRTCEQAKDNLPKPVFAETLGKCFFL